MFTETPDTFLKDFGVPVIYGAQSAYVLFDQADTQILSQRVQTTQYRMEYAADKLLGLKNGDVVLIGIGPGWRIDSGGTRLEYIGDNPDTADSGRFRVLGTPNRLDDGAFVETHLERI
jgi:hypothetical protein